MICKASLISTVTEGRVEVCCFYWEEESCSQLSITLVYLPASRIKRATQLTIQDSSLGFLSHLFLIPSNLVIRKIETEIILGSTGKNSAWQCQQEAIVRQKIWLWQLLVVHYLCIPPNSSHCIKDARGYFSTCLCQCLFIDPLSMNLPNSFLNLLILTSSTVQIKNLWWVETGYNLLWMKMILPLPVIFFFSLSLYIDIYFLPLSCL